LYLSASADGVNWSPQAQAPSGATSTSPALAAFNGKLYAAWKGEDNDESLYLSASIDGVNWSPQAQAPFGFTSTSPALAAFNSRLYASWKGPANNGIDQSLYLSSSPDPVPLPPLIIWVVNATNNSATIAWNPVSHSIFQSLTMYTGDGEGRDDLDAKQLVVTDTSCTMDLVSGQYNVWYTLRAVAIYGGQVSNSVNVQYPKPPVTLPDVIGMVYADAVTKLQGDGLQVEETNVTGIFNTADYKVTGQSPTGGTPVSSGSTVQLTIAPITQPPTGYSTVTVNNLNTDNRSVDLYLVDLTSNPNVATSEGTLDMNDSQAISLTTNGHYYQVIAVDTEMDGCTGGSDPEFTYDCQRKKIPPPGVLCSSTGGTYPLNVY
jgi:hypothetical protein